MTIAIYLRISKSDDDINEKDESNSIENQRQLIYDYISRHQEFDGDIKEYVDDGYTGTNFNRPAFQSMLSDSRAGKINVLIAKDMSRIGRDYIEMGDYVEQIFPAMGVRVIAINSGYDSFNNVGNIAGLDVAITNFINTMYSRDIGQKRRSADRIRWAMGKSSPKQEPYGYVRKKKTREWIIDDEAAEVVKYIFEKAANGWSTKKIVNELNKMEKLPPGLYRRYRCNYKYNFKVSDHENLWDVGKVRNVIKRYEYTGTLIAHKSESVIFTFNKSKSVPKDEWIYIENHHPAIVSKKLFEDAQYAIKYTKTTDDKKPASYSLKRKLRCGNCRLMFAYKEFENDKICYCAHKLGTGDYSTCLGKTYRYKQLEESVYKYLIGMINDIRVLNSMMENAIKLETPERKKNLEYYESRVEILKADRIRKYEDYASGVISATEYKFIKDKLNTELDEMISLVETLRNQMEQDESLSREVRLKKNYIENVATEEKLTKRMVDSFIKTVYVHDIDKLEIEYTFDDLTSKIFMRNNEIMMKYYPDETKRLMLDEMHTYINAADKKVEGEEMDVEKNKDLLGGNKSTGD